jgi:PAS domain S-box-containing protein
MSTAPHIISIRCRSPLVVKDVSRLNPRTLLRPIPILLLTFLPLITLPTTASAAEKKVLLLFCDKSNGAIAAYNEALQSSVRAGSVDRITFYEEYMDLWLYPGDDYLSLLHGFYGKKYQGQRFDLIIAQSPPVLSFLLKYGDELYPGTPIVFGNAEKTRLKGLNLRPNITGVMLDVRFGPTLDAALRMQPDVQRVVVVGGTSEIDVKYLDKARTEFRSFEGRVEFTYLIGLPMEELEKRLARLPEQTITFYVCLFRDGSGQPFILMDSMARVAKASNVPTYGVMDRFIEAGSIGGFVVSLGADAREVAKIALRVLSGEKPADIPIRIADTNRHMFNWRQLRRWGIAEQKLPPGSILLFKELSFWELYKWRIVAVILLLILEALLIFWLLINRSRRRQAEEAKDKLAAIVESSDDAILSNTLEGTMTSWNAGAKKIYGFSASEMLGKNVSILSPPDLKEELPVILERIRRGESIDHLETVRLTKEGWRINVSLTISPIKDEHGIIIGASTIARDITERKRDEQALQQLTGRLLMLQDEERQRVAGELHDGLGQSLAIIKNRALIGLGDQTNQDQAIEQLEEISAMATSAIHEVREIAHNLRPYELDRLGLVAAIESMIERVSESTSINLTADLERIDGLLPPEAETSIYRIVQESLNNVVKHSQATAARVEIKKNGKQLAISVQDNGKGMPVPAPADNGNHARGFGLAGIAERARLLGGSLAIDSQPTLGTTLAIRLELSVGTRE